MIDLVLKKISEAITLALIVYVVLVVGMASVLALPLTILYFMAK